MEKGKGDEWSSPFSYLLGNCFSFPHQRDRLEDDQGEDSNAEDQSERVDQRIFLAVSDKYREFSECGEKDSDA